MNNYTFECTLFKDKGQDIEEFFTASIEAHGMYSALDKIGTLLENDWGYITKRTFQGERMRSDRYWDIRLLHLDILPVDIQEVVVVK